MALVIAAITAVVLVSTLAMSVTPGVNFAAASSNGNNNNRDNNPSSSSPGRTGNTPGQSGNTPGQSGNTPGQSEGAGTPPGRTGNTPGQSGNTPGQCEEPNELCNGKCINPSTFLTDENNCGSCGNRCGVGEFCDGGQCRDQCGSGETFCPNAPVVQCRNLNGDPQNCGACGRDCNTAFASGSECINSQCLCPDGQEVVNGQCETPCPSGTVRDPEGNCECSDPSQTLVNGQCQCRDPNKEIVKGKCEDRCPPNAGRTSTGECLCVDAFKHIVDGQCVNICPSDDQILCRMPGSIAETCVSFDSGIERGENGQCQCGEGKELVNGQCQCAEGKELVDGQCVNKCPPGQTRAANGQCVSDLCPPDVRDHPDRLSCGGSDCCLGGGIFQGQTTCLVPAEPGSICHPAKQVCDLTSNHMFGAPFCST